MDVAVDVLVDVVVVVVVETTKGHCAEAKKTFWFLSRSFCGPSFREAYMKLGFT